MKFELYGIKHKHELTAEEFDIVLSYSKVATVTEQASDIGREFLLKVKDKDLLFALNIFPSRFKFKCIAMSNKKQNIEEMLKLIKEVQKIKNIH
jgi:hypothetical protein